MGRRLCRWRTPLHPRPPAPPASWTAPAGRRAPRSALERPQTAAAPCRRCGSAPARCSPAAGRERGPARVCRGEERDLCKVAASSTIKAGRGASPAALPTRTHVQQLGCQQLAHAAGGARHQHSGTRLLQQGWGEGCSEEARMRPASRRRRRRQPQVVESGRSHLSSQPSPLLLHARSAPHAAGAGEARPACSNGTGWRPFGSSFKLHWVVECCSLAAKHAPAA